MSASMPTFCRHNRLISNCPICSREQNVELRPVVSSGTPRGSESARSPRATRPAGARPTRSASGGVTVRRLARGTDDGFHSDLVPGLKSSVDAERLAEELAFAATRLRELGTDPPGLYAEVAADGDLEERSWLALLIAYVGAGEGYEPFAQIERVRVPWSAGLTPSLEEVTVGPRGAHQASRGTTTLDAYRAWAQRSGSQAQAFTGDSAWTPERRFARAFERLALPGLDRGARFELLNVLGATGCYELQAGALGLGGPDTVTLAAKRLLGIGDPHLLERRSADLAAACGLPLGALDAGFFNWERGERATLGMDALEPEPDLLVAIGDALGL